MRALIIKVLVGLLLAAIIVVFALLIFLFGSSARPVWVKSELGHYQIVALLG
jgi:hypothetical protein